MPYITEKAQASLIDLGGDQIRSAATPGELNYLLTLTITDYLAKHGKSYQTINDIVGALIGAKDEFTRRVVVPYEDNKIKENGDVY